MCSQKYSLWCLGGKCTRPLTFEIFFYFAQRDKYDRFGDDEELDGDVDMDAFMAMFGYEFFKKCSLEWLYAVNIRGH